MVGQETDQGILLAALVSEPRRHGMAAAFDEQSSMYGRAYDTAEIDARDRARRAGGVAVGLQARDETGKAEAVGNAPGDQPEQAFVPAFGAEKQQRPAGIGRERDVGPRKRVLQH